MKKFVLTPKSRINIIFLSVFVVLMAMIAILNFAFNPYEVFNHRLNVCMTYDKSCDRQILYPKMKMRIGNDYDYLFCGSSSVLLSISEDSFARLFPDKSLYKIGVKAATVSEKYDMVKNFISENPEVKTVIVGVEFDEMTKTNENELPKYTGSKLNAGEWCFLLFSANTLKFSLESVYYTTKEILVPQFLFSLKRNQFFSKFKVFRNYRYKEVTDYLRFPRVRYTDWKERKVNDDLFVDQKRIKDLCEQNNKEVIFCLTPLHANAIYDIYYQGSYEQIEHVKRKLVKIAPFYDFLYVNEKATQPISPQNPYWMNAMHPDEALGDLMIEKMVTKEGKYGVLVTEDNVETVLKSNRQALLKYAKENKKALQEYTSYDHLDFTTQIDVIYHDE